VCVVSYLKWVFRIHLLGMLEGFCLCSRLSGLSVQRPAPKAVKHLISLPAIRHSGVLNTVKSLSHSLLWLFVMSGAEHAQRKHLGHLMTLSGPIEAVGTRRGAWG
jgi:hypothetical protein